MSKIFILSDKNIIDNNWFYGLFIDFKKYKKVSILNYSYIRGLSIFFNLSQSAKIKSFIFNFFLKKNDIIFVPTILYLHHIDISLIKCKVILLCHDAIPFESNQKELTGVNYSEELINKWKTNIKLLNKIFTVSNYSKNRISKLLEINLSKIEVIKNGLDPEFFVQNNHLLYKKNKNNKFIYVLISSSNAPRKNFKIIEEVVNKTNIIYPDIKYIRVGPRQSYFNKYENCIDLGYISKKELVSLYKFCDILLFPSIYEGFGLPILEAMYMQLSIITTNLTSIPEVCGFDGAHFIDPSSSDEIIQKLLYIKKNPEIEKHRNKINFNKSMNFYWEANKILNINE